MSLTKLHFEQFTAFDKLTLEFSPGINVFIGKNGTGKTHIMKATYAACDITKTKIGFSEKLNRIFLPSGLAPWSVTCCNRMNHYSAFYYQSAIGEAYADLSERTIESCE